MVKSSTAVPSKVSVRKWDAKYRKREEGKLEKRYDFDWKENFLWKFQGLVKILI